MGKKWWILIGVVIVILGYFVLDFFVLTPSLGEYYASLDFSCEVDADCEIKNIGSCCGGYPKCVNVDAKADPDLVDKVCTFGSGLCGFPSVKSCSCVDNVCKSVGPSGQIWPDNP